MPLDRADIMRYNDLEYDLNKLIGKYFCQEDNKMMTKYIYYGYDTEDYTGDKPEDSAFVVYGYDIGWKIVENGNELFRLFRISDDDRSKFMDAVETLKNNHDTYHERLVKNGVKPAVYLGRKIRTFRNQFTR